MTTQFASLFIGDVTPDVPSSQAVWLSHSLEDLTAQTTPGRKNVVITTDQTYETGTLRQEPSVWYANGLWNMTYSAGGGLGYASATHPSGPWTKGPAIVLGAGSGGFAGNPLHHNVYVEGPTLYCYFVDSTNTTRWLCATASISAPTVWTTIAVGTFAFAPGTAYTSGGMGNTSLIKLDDGTYAMFFETNYNGSWQIGLAQGAAPLGTFSVTTFPMVSLAPSSYQSKGYNPSSFPYGNPWVGKNNGKYVMYYGASGPNAGLNDIYRATSTDLMEWTLDNGGYPIIRRTHSKEVDQAVDPFLCQGPNGNWWAFWSGCDNKGAVGYIFSAPMLPSLKIWDGDRWTLASDGIDQFGQTAFNQTQLEAASTLTLVHMDEDVVDTTSASKTRTLPPAAQGAMVRVINAGPNAGVNTVTVNPGGADTIPTGAPVLTVGQVATFKCYVQGRWVRIS